MRTQISTKSSVTSDRISIKNYTIKYNYNNDKKNLKYYKIL